MPSDTNSTKKPSKRTSSKSPKAKADVEKALFAGLAATKLFPVDLQPIPAAPLPPLANSSKAGQRNKHRKSIRDQQASMETLPQETSTEATPSKAMEEYEEELRNAGFSDEEISRMTDFT
jgi:hypothetical protein